MPDPEEEKSESERRDCFMDLDLDLETSWPLDFVSSNPLSPLLFSSSSEQPCSPLWAFSDEDAGANAGFRVSDCPVVFTCNNTSSAAGNMTEDDDNSTKKIPSPLLEWIPMESSDQFCLIKERMTQALRYFKESTEQHVLAQIWAPVKNGGRYVLTTSGQPFVLDPHSTGLHQYRMVSLMYVFSVEGEIDGALGLPGRVFRQKVPEWTPNVLYYSNKEYSRRDHALNYNVRGTLALPVFEPAGQSCVGVLELIMTSQKINYAPEVDKVCKALEAVNLKSSKILDHPNPQICNEGRQNALVEILEILTVVCETHKLPLAQTWVPCMHRSVLANGGGLNKSCSSFDGSCNGQVCMSITDLAFYVVDAHMWGFHEACLEHHLQKGQGVAGRAFLSHNSCFCQDITKFCKTEYPLVHYARWFGLTSCFAICLRSSHTGDDDYVLEFYLPPVVTNHHEQKILLGAILATLKQHLQSLRVASGMDLEEEGFVEIIEASISGTINTGLECILIPRSVKSAPHANPLPNGGMMALLDSSKLQPREDLDAVNDGSASVPESKEKKKTSERKRGKTEKSISLEVLQQYFSGSLKDAAKSLGVCPTTMKRICRQHGISRWPSRKINKVNRSLSKLKRVIESVQGADGTFSLNPLATSPLPVAVGSISWPSNLNACSPQNPPNSINYEPHGIKNGSPTPGSGQVGVEDQLVGGSVFSQEQLLRSWLSPELNEASVRLKTGSGSREESAGSHTSHGSCQDSPANESTPPKEHSASPVHGQCIKAAGSPDLVLRPVGEHCLLPAYSIPDLRITTELQEPFEGMLMEDAGSSKDLRNLCQSEADAIIDERIPESGRTNPQCQDILTAQILATSTSTPAMAPFSDRPEMKIITIKATYREDIIRFRISLNSGILELREEVAKRLKSEEGTFDIKYLDDDHEWVLIACDADLQECVDISRSSGSNIIRLSVHDLNANPGSSCESTGEL